MPSRSSDNPFVTDPDVDFAPPETLSQSEAEIQVSRLREAIEYHDQQYYVENEPVIADRTYDALFDRLVELEEAFGLEDAASPSQRVGGQPVDELATVEHVAPMLSLDSSADETEVRAFADRVREAVGPVEYSAEPKFDGISVEVVYEDGVFARAVTRGDGERGDDITHNARTIRSIPLRLSETPELVALRGEIYMPQSGFHALNERRVREGKEPFANPRNATAGTVRQLDPSVVADRPLEIYFYDVLASSVELSTQREAVDFMRELGLRVSELTQFVDGIEPFIAYRDELLDQREDLEVETDGVVGKVNDFAIRTELGTTARHPRWAFAYKFPARRGETTVQRIIVQVGRTGKLTPVALLDPVDVTGVTISRATLHNESIVQELGVVEGSRVKVERAGDVIPEVSDVIEAPDGTFSMPTSCPVCDSDVIEEGEYHYCTGGTTCPAQLRRGIEHFCSKQAMDIQGVGEKVANQLVDAGLVESLADLYELTKADFLELELFGEQASENLLAELEASKETTRDRFLFGLGIRHVGRERARQLAAAFTIEDLMSASLEELQACEDVGPEVARSIHSFFRNDANVETVERLLAAGITFQTREMGDEFDGVTVVFTGSIEGYTRSELTDHLERHGARVTSAVSGETDYLVVGENPGSTKMNDAQAHDVELLDAEEFEARFLRGIESPA